MSKKDANTAAKKGAKKKSMKKGAETLSDEQLDEVSGGIVGNCGGGDRDPFPSGFGGQSPTPTSTPSPFNRKPPRQLGDPPDTW